jgi:hypothetical protein
MNANYTGEHGNRTKPRITNDLFDYLQKWKGWVGADAVSRAKFDRDVSDQFGLSLSDASAAVAEVFGANYASPTVEG